jgi:hypothetical protein
VHQEQLVAWQRILSPPFFQVLAHLLPVRQTPHSLVFSPSSNQQEKRHSLPPTVATSLHRNQAMCMSILGPRSHGLEPPNPIPFPNSRGSCWNGCRSLRALESCVGTLRKMHFRNISLLCIQKFNPTSFQPLSRTQCRPSLPIAMQLGPNSNSARLPMSRISIRTLLSIHQNLAHSSLFGSSEQSQRWLASQWRHLMCKEPNIT